MCYAACSLKRSVLTLNFYSRSEYGVTWKVLEDVLPDGPPCFHPPLPCLGMSPAQQHKPEEVPSLLKSPSVALCLIPSKWQRTYNHPKVLCELQCSPHPITSCLIHSAPRTQEQHLLAFPWTCQAHTPASRLCITASSAWNRLLPDLHMIHSHQIFTHVSTTQRGVPQQLDLIWHPQQATSSTFIFSQHSQHLTSYTIYVFCLCWSP